MNLNELLDAVLTTLNERYPELGFRKRFFSAKTSIEVGAATRRFVEPGLFRVDRETRGVPRKIQRVRIVAEGFPATVDALEAAIIAERETLERLALDFVKNPTKIVAGAFCQSASAFADAPPLYDPVGAEYETPYLFGGIELEFYWY